MAGEKFTLPIPETRYDISEATANEIGTTLELLLNPKTVFNFMNTAERAIGGYDKSELTKYPDRPTYEPFGQFIMHLPVIARFNTEKD